MFIVICKIEGWYCLATRNVFRHREDAERYAAGVNSLLNPIVVSGEWNALRVNPAPPKA